MNWIKGDSPEEEEYGDYWTYCRLQNNIYVRAEIEDWCVKELYWSGESWVHPSQDEYGMEEYTVVEVSHYMKYFTPNPPVDTQ